MEMAELYSRHSKSKSTKHRKDREPMRSKQREEINQKRSDNSNYRQVEAKTPPLPTKTSTLEDLIKERETLKQELQKMEKKKSETNLKNKYEANKETRKRKQARDDYAYEINSKRYYNVNEAGMDFIKKQIREQSPDVDKTQVDSEDEETIIELRRQQRKQLLEKLSESHDNLDRKNSVKSDRTHTEEENAKNFKINYVNQNISKQITDMFSEKDEFESNNLSSNVSHSNNDSNLSLTDNWDDAEGYYNVRVGDIINNRYTVKGLLGQGVFANVLRAQDNSEGNDYVAIKVVRNNDLMYRTSLKEIAVLKEINESDPDGKYHCVKLLGHFMHRNHLCIVLESLHMDLRGVIKKYGKHHGLNMKALISYSRQLLLALRLLKKVGIVHADVKPDNILVNEKKNVLKLCDFGSSAKIDDNEPTPYLVSRFYRAPEIILGIPYKHGVDVWSAACTIYEMAAGKILFTGSSNNKMLKCFMDLKGKFPSKLIRRGKFKDQHFNYNNNFLLHKKDEFTGREKVVELGNITPTRDLNQELNKSYKASSSSEEKKMTQLKDLLDRMTILDSSQRLSATDCLKHPFIQEDLNRDS